jgi:hypothetical protein
MNAAIPYVVLAFSVITGGMAAASLVQSSEERWVRQSLFYTYGTFLFYAILSVIGIFVLIGMYQSGSLTGIVVTTAAGGGLSVLFGQDFAALGRGVGPIAVNQARKAGYLGELSKEEGAATAGFAAAAAAAGSAVAGSAASRKYRRQVGHGRYHT